jgi:hypothetical protein
METTAGSEERQIVGIDGSGRRRERAQWRCSEAHWLDSWCRMGMSRVVKTMASLARLGEVPNGGGNRSPSV